ncbi:aldo/keto reductase [Streptomyces sp. NPDC002577]
MHGPPSGGGRARRWREEFIGATLGQRRDEVVIATMFLSRPKGEPCTPGVLRRRIVEACEGSMRRLRTDRIDLYHQHNPDPEAPADEALLALDELVRAGKVLHIASSNVDAAQLTGAAGVAGPGVGGPLLRHVVRVERALQGGGDRPRPCRPGAQGGSGAVLPAGLGGAHRQVLTGAARSTRTARGSTPWRPSWSASPRASAYPASMYASAPPESVRRVVADLGIRAAVRRSAWPRRRRATPSGPHPKGPAVRDRGALRLRRALSRSAVAGQRAA